MCTALRGFQLQPSPFTFSLSVTPHAPPSDLCNHLRAVNKPKVCFKRAYSSSDWGLNAFRGRAAERERGRGIPKTQAAAQGTPVVRTGSPSSRGRTLPSFIGVAPHLPRQHCCPPPVVSGGKTTLRVGFREKLHPFKIKLCQKESSLQYKLHLIIQNTSQSPGCFLGTATRTSSTLQKPALSSWIRSWPQK